MTKNEAGRLKLKEITKGFLKTDDYAAMLSAANGLSALLSEITDLCDDTQDPLCLEETMLGEGKALSPRDAARCISDFMRTANFIGGLRAAVLEARHRFPDEIIHVLYAGCGPFAPLMIAQTGEFTPAQVQFTLLDIHQKSLDTARQIVDALGLASFVRDYVCADAVTYKHPRESRLHVILTETMQRALTKEPQVMITGNLVPQLIAGGILVPQKVAISACLSDLGQEMSFTVDGTPKRQRVYLGKVFELTAESARSIREWPISDEEKGARSSPPASLRVPQLDAPPYTLMLLTEITVFESFHIGDYQSGITYPVVCHESGHIEGGTRIEFYYRTGAHPGLRHRILR